MPHTHTHTVTERGRETTMDDIILATCSVSGAQRWRGTHDLPQNTCWTTVALVDGLRATYTTELLHCVVTRQIQVHDQTVYIGVIWACARIRPCNLSAWTFFYYVPAEIGNDGQLTIPSVLIQPTNFCLSSSGSDAECFIQILDIVHGGKYSSRSVDCSLRVYIWFVYFGAWCWL